ncbi:MAG: T9SS type A sorting domain-containing protein [Bacteroidota bacterium]
MAPLLPTARRCPQPVRPFSVRPFAGARQVAHRRLEWLRRSAAAGALTLAMLQGAPDAAAQVASSTTGPEFRVTTETAGSQSAPSVATDADGDYVVVWDSFGQDGNNLGVYAQRYDATGVAQGSEFLVNTETSESQRDPVVAMDADGNFVVVWESLIQDGSGQGIYAQRYAADGTAQGSEFQVNTVTPGDQQFPAVAMDADGDFVVVWTTYAQDGNQNGIYARRYEADGSDPATNAGEFQVNTFTTNSQEAPSVGMDDAGNFVVAWDSYTQDGNGRGVYAQRYDANGDPVDGEFRVNATTASNQGDPSVALEPDGDFVIAWRSYQDGSGNGVYAQRYDAAGVAQGGEFQVNTFTTDNQTIPQVAVDADGDFVIAWASRGQDGDNYGVYAQRYTADGSTDGAEFRVNTYTTSTQGRPAVGMDAAGDFVVAWNSFAQDGDGFGIYAQRYAAPAYSLSEIPAGLEFQVNSETAGTQGTPSVAADDGGDFIVAWNGEGPGDGNGGIYAQRYDALGVAQGSQFRVNTYTTGVQRLSSVATDADGGFVIAWESDNQDGDGRGIYARRYAADGTALDLADFAVNTYTTGNQRLPAVAMDADGDFVIVWSGESSGDSNGIVAQRYAADGTPQGSEFQVNIVTGSNQARPSVAMDDDGDFVIAWRTFGQDGSQYSIYARRYARDGTPQGGEFQVNTYTTGTQRISSAGMDADGDFVIAWQSEDQDGDGDGIFAQRFAADGTPEGSEFRVNTTTTGTQRISSVAMDADGDFVIAWASASQDGDDDGVYAQRYAADGTPQGSEFQVNSFTTDNQREPSVATDADGDFVVAWQSASQDGDGTGVFAQRFALTQPTVNGGTYALPVLGTEGWRMLAQPNGSTLATLLDPLWTQGVPDGDVTNGSANVLVYDETDPTADEDVGFVAPTSLATSTPGEGFIVFVFADDDFDGTADAFPKTLSAPYTAPAGTVSPTVSFTDNSAPDADGWNLLGNPFAEPLSWDAVRANAGFQNVEATVYVWDPLANAYRTWNGSSGDLLGGEIAGGQGFFVKATGAGAAAPFASDDTGAIDSRTYSAYSRVGTPVKLALTLATEVGEARAFVEAGFGGEQGRDRKDGVLLAPLSGTFAQVFTRPLTEEAEADPLAINSLDLEALASSESAVAIPLGFAAFEAGVPAGGAMTLRWPETLMPEGWRVELRDTATGAVVNLKETTEYAFTLAAAAASGAPEIAASAPGTQAVPPLLRQGVTNPVARVSAADRFELVLTPASVVATEGDAALPEVLTLSGNYPNPFSDETTLRYGVPEAAAVRVAVYDVLGREVLVVQDGPQQAGWHTLGVDAGRLASGLYVWRVEAETAAGREAKTGRMLVVK